MKDQLLSAIAEELHEAARTHSAVRHLSERFPELTAEDAYRIQKMNRDQRTAEGASAVGYKIGLTATDLMRSMNVSEPDYGVLFQDKRVPTDGEVAFDRLFEPKVEAEIAFIMGEDLPANALPEDVRKAVAYITAAFEIVETRIPGWRNRITDTVADNASAGHFMLSEMGIVPDTVDFPLLCAAIRKNGALLAEGSAEVVMGDPLRSVAWLGNKLRQHGELLKKGDIVLSGALCGAHIAVPGDRFEADFGPLGILRIAFQ